MIAVIRPPPRTSASHPRECNNNNTTKNQHKADDRNAHRNAHTNTNSNSNKKTRLTTMRARAWGRRRSE
eukprot:2152846-Rhodomonas_salina.2